MTVINNIPVGDQVPFRCQKNLTSFIIKYDIFESSIKISWEGGSKLKYEVLNPCKIRFQC